MGIEPTYPAWKAGVLPLNYTRMCPVSESNQGHTDFQSVALPTELTGRPCCESLTTKTILLKTFRNVKPLLAYDSRGR